MNKIQQQRDELAKKESITLASDDNSEVSSELINSSVISNSTCSFLNSTNKNEEDEVTKTSSGSSNENSLFWSPNHSVINKIKNDNQINIRNDINTNNIIDSSIVSSIKPDTAIMMQRKNNETVSMISDIQNENLNIVSDSQNNKEKQTKNKNLINLCNVMMSSHNVSSINNDLVDNRMLGLATNNSRITKNENISNLIDVSLELTQSVSINQEKCYSEKDLNDGIINLKSNTSDSSQNSKEKIENNTKELITKSDLMLAIENKHIKLQKQQEELESKLKKLEEQEKLLEIATNKQSKQTISSLLPLSNKRTITSSSSGGGIDSGNDHNYCSDSIDNLSSSYNYNKNSEQKLAEYERNIIKLIEQKERLESLEKHYQNNKELFIQQISSRSNTSNDASMNIINDMNSTNMNKSITANNQTLNESRIKLDLLKQFDLMSLLNYQKESGDESDNNTKRTSESKSSNNNINNRNSINKLLSLNSYHQDDKHTVYSTDSGFTSAESNNYFNNIKQYSTINNYLKLQRNKENNSNNNSSISNTINSNIKNNENINNNMIIINDNQENSKNSINLAVEQLNTEIMHAASIIKEHRKIETEEEVIKVYEQQAKLNAEKDNTAIIENANLFGLEFFDLQNMSDIRDNSIENLIGWNGKQQENNSSSSKLPTTIYSDNKLSSQINDNHTSYLSSDDTLNDEDSLKIFNIVKTNRTNNNNNIDNSNINKQNDKEFEDNLDDENQAIVSSLLSSRAKQLAEISTQPIATLNSLDWQRKFIQDQLEIVRKQKEQLQQQHTLQQKQTQNQQQLQEQEKLTQSQQNIIAPLVSSLNSSNKFHKLVNDNNLHELSTIKEVDTPISERNLKLTHFNSNSNKQNQLNVLNINYYLIKKI